MTYFTQTKIVTTIRTALLASAVMLAGCGSPEQSGGAKKDMDPAKSYAMRGADHSWPGEAKADLTLAENKSARNFYVIFDGSGSMEETGCGDGQQRINAAKKSIKTFFNVMPKDSNVGLFIFDAKGSRETTPLQPLDVAALNSQINRVQSGSNTPLGKALREAYGHLLVQGQKQQGYGEYNIVVITDGAASDVDMMNDMVGQITARSPISLHTIGFCLDDDHSLNKKGVVNYRSASNVAELVEGLQAVLSEAEAFDTASFDGSQ